MTSSPFSSFADAATLGDVLRRNAATRPDKIAFSSPDGRSVSFAGFNDRVNRLNNAVAALGLRKGARIAILSRNRQEYVESYGLSKSRTYHRPAQLAPVRRRVDPSRCRQRARTQRPALRKA